MFCQGVVPTNADTTVKLPEPSLDILASETGIMGRAVRLLTNNPAGEVEAIEREGLKVVE